MSKQKPDLGQCCVILPGDGFHSYQCSRKAKVIHDGAAYCGQHNPKAVKARRDKSQARWDAESKVREGKNRRRDAEINACQDFSTKALELGIVKKMQDVIEASIGWNWLDNETSKAMECAE